MRKSLFILVISLLLPIVCYAQESIQSAKNKAQKGDAEAQLELGICYYTGDGVAKDYKQAVYWFKKAAEQGRVEAQYYLGICYYEGEGVAKDLNQAVYWFKKAAEQGHEDAKIALKEVGIQK